MKGGLAWLDDEVAAQPNALKRFLNGSIRRAPYGSAFVGAGDSYAAALAAFFSSDGRCIALDPYALASNPRMADGRHIYFISVSGKTSSNLGAALKVRQRAKRTTAITAVADSPLARLTNSTIILPMEYEPRTPSMLSFCLALLAVLRIVGRDCAGDYHGSYNKAKREPSLSFGRGVTYFLGNSLAYPVALYAAAKTYELIGLRAQAEQLEEFSHMQLFSLTKSDTVNAFSAFDPSGIAPRLSQALQDRGYVSNKVENWGSSFTEKLFHSVFVVQLSVLKEARRRGFAEPRFLADKKRLHVSDSMIY